MIFASICLNSSGLIVLTVALVPTGINIGVSNEPCGVCTIPKRAPDCLQVLMCSVCYCRHIQKSSHSFYIINIASPKLKNLYSKFTAVL